VIAKLLVLAALTSPLTAAYSRTVRFDCGLGRGGIAVFHILRPGTIDGIARYHKPSGEKLVVHHKAQDCVSPNGCIVAVKAEGHRGYKLDYIVEKSSAEFTRLAKKCW